MRRYVWLLMLMVLAGTLALTVAGCGSPEKALRARAADFYSFLRGERPDDSYLDYLSPERKQEIGEKMGPAHLELLAATIGGRTNPQNPPTASRSVKAQVQGHFGISWVEARQDEPLMQSSPVKWVLVKGVWYLFQGSEAEVKQFGEYPRELLQRQPRGRTVPKAPSQPIEEQAPEKPPSPAGG